MKGDVKNTYCSGAEKGVLCGSAESQGLFFFQPVKKRSLLLVTFF